VQSSRSSVLRSHSQSTQNRRVFEIRSLIRGSD
jgi:hypothetical protein